MVEQSPAVALFRRHHEYLLDRFLELERKKLPADEVDQQLVELGERFVREHNTAALVSGSAQLDEEGRREFIGNVRGIMGGGALAPLLDRHDVENIHILGHDNVVLSLANGERVPAAPVAASEEELVMMIRHLAATAGHTSRRFDTASPILDLRLASGHRLFAVTAVAERTSVVIRRHRMLQASMAGLAEKGTVTPPIVEVLRAAVKPPNPCNLLVVGGTGAGKTTLLRSLISEVPQWELLVTIEDTLELHLRTSGLHPRTLALETRTANTEGTGEISTYDLCKAALRMSPDRVIVGEVRGGEVMQLLQAMGIGNDGSLGTIHAGSTRAAINKMLIYAQRSPDAPTPDSVMREIAEVMHLLVYIKKLPDGRRAVTSIREITGYEDGKVLTSEVFGPGPDGVAVYTRPFKADGEVLARLRESGFDPAGLGEPSLPEEVRRDRVRHGTRRPAAAPPQPAAPHPGAAPARPQAHPQPAPQVPPQRPHPQPAPQPAPRPAPAQANASHAPPAQPAPNPRPQQQPPQPQAPAYAPPGRQPVQPSPAQAAPRAPVQQPTGHAPQQQPTPPAQAAPRTPSQQPTGHAPQQQTAAHPPAQAAPQAPVAQQRPPAQAQSQHTVATGTPGAPPQQTAGPTTSSAAPPPQQPPPPPQAAPQPPRPLRSVPPPPEARR